MWTLFNGLRDYLLDNLSKASEEERQAAKEWCRSRPKLTPLDKMRAAKRTDSTKVWVCPNPKCGFETTMPSRVLRKHFHNEPLKTGNVAEYSKECKAWLCEKADDTATLKEVFGQRFKFYL